MDYSILSHFRCILREIKIDGIYLTEVPQSVKTEVGELSSLYSISPRQVVLLTAVMDLCGFGSTEFSRLAGAMQCDFFSFLTMKKDLDALRNRELIEGTQSISIPPCLIDSIVENRPHTPNNISDMSTKRIMDKLVSLHREVIEKHKSPLVFLRTVDSMILNNQSTSLAMAADRYGVLCYDSVPENLSDDDSYTCSAPPDERMIFYCLLARIDEKVSWYELSTFFSPRQVKSLQERVRGMSLSIQREGVVESVSDYSSDECLQMCPKIKDQVMSDIGGADKTPFSPEIVRFTSIIPRKLYYPETVGERVGELASLLSRDRFTQVRDALSHSGLRTGFAVLFYGAPGTGKTETVLQIARCTSRDVITVNVADVKDTYLGQTEKNIKGVFDRYRQYAMDSGVFPILLFNEADAILGTRMKNPGGAADRTENSMQNIILEQMENLDGIMIATTNLSVNLDRAFDRRFLYRIRFTRPDIQSMAGILSSMLPELSAAEAESIAEEFSLSGGQIENVCRRKTILSAVKGRPATFEEIRRLCAEESSPETSLPKIGF